jgi:putative ABC transport system substrate-binding protein
MRAHKSAAKHRTERAAEGPLSATTTRRTFVAVLGTAAALSRMRAVSAQTSTVPVIGFLHSTSVAAARPRIAGFLDGLNAAGRAVGRNVAIEYRWAEGEFNRLPRLAQEFVDQPVAVLVTGAPSAALAASSATTTIPIVFVMGADPVKLGLVRSFSRPGANVTGVAVLTVSLVTKRLQLLRTLVPNADTIGFILNPSNPTAEDQIGAMRAAAQSLAQRLEIMPVSNHADLDTLSGRIASIRPKALVVGADSFLISQGKRLVALAAQHAIPAIYETRESVALGGLASYAADFNDGYRQAGLYVGRILGGERPADLPVVQPTRFELTVNLKTAKTLGLAIPPTVLAVADEVIE